MAVKTQISKIVKNTNVKKALKKANGVYIIIANYINITLFYRAYKTYCFHVKSFVYVRKIIFCRKRVFSVSFCNTDYELHYMTDKLSGIVYPSWKLKYKSTNDFTKYLIFLHGKYITLIVLTDKLILPIQGGGPL